MIHQQVQIFPIANHSKHARPIASHSVIAYTDSDVVLPSAINYIPHLSRVSPQTIPLIPLHFHSTEVM
jgi:hypothetical protein